MPPKRSTPRMLHRAWELRRDMTSAEQKLWLCLRTLRAQGIHFRRQHAIGQHIADFCAPTHGLIIELDGGGHLDQQEEDAERTQYLQAHGYRVLRFWNWQVLDDLPGVMEKIQNAISSTE